MFCWTQPSGWVLLMLWYKMIDVWLSVIGWSDRRHPILKVLHHCKGILDRKMHNKCSVFKIRREQLTCWHVENEFWGQKHGYETDHLKNNLQLEVFESRIATKRFYLIELNSYHIQFFSNSCWSNQFQALSDRLCLYQERSSKLRVSKTILTNPCKIIQFPQCGNIYVSHLKKRTPSIIVVTASQFVKLSKLIGMCNLNFTVC